MALSSLVSFSTSQFTTFRQPMEAPTRVVVSEESVTQLTILEGTDPNIIIIPNVYMKGECLNSDWVCFHYTPIYYDISKRLYVWFQYLIDTCKHDYFYSKYYTHSTPWQQNYHSCPCEGRNHCHHSSVIDKERSLRVCVNPCRKIDSN